MMQTTKSKKSQPARSRVVFICNGIFGDRIAGGDIHFLQLAKAAEAAGYALHFIGGHALEKQLKNRFSHYGLTLTDAAQASDIQGPGLGSQFRLFRDFFRRFRSTMKQLAVIEPGDVVYAVSDFWFDVVPAVRSQAGAKLMVWHMQAPSFLQILTRSRPDVDVTRLASLHFWASQNFSISLFRRCPNKRMLHVHPNMRPILLQRGYQPEELKYASFGVDVPAVDPKAGTAKTHDVAWIGRVHRQKGVEDLVATVAHLARRIEDFRAILIGDVRRELQPRFEQMGLAKAVEFTGFVSEEEKFRILRSSRVYLMPSRFEGSPRVVGEALLCGMPVVAYDVGNYRPLFGEFVRYVPCFDQGAFQVEAERQVLATRTGKNYLSLLDAEKFRAENSWISVGKTFLDAIGETLNRGQR
jgi:glycosyltransferase involved in cell wall biosynthesis